MQKLWDTCDKSRSDAIIGLTSGSGSPALLAISTNSQIQEVGGTCLWTFPQEPAVIVTRGCILRATFHTEANAESTTYAQGLASVGLRCATNTVSGLGCLSGTGAISASNIIPVHALTLFVSSYAPAEHVEDTTAHVSESDRTTWNAAAAQLNAAPVFTSYSLTDATPLDAALFVQNGVLDVEVNYVHGVVDAIGSLSMHTLFQDMPDSTSLTLILRLGASMTVLNGITLEQFMGEYFAPFPPGEPATAWCGKLIKSNGTVYYAAMPLIGY